jgi:plastocyanin
VRHALSLLLVLAVSGCRIDKGFVQPLEGTVLVDILDTRFDPDTVHAEVGGRVRWTNRGAQVHTISSTIFESQNLFPTWWVEARFDSAGIYDYFCTLHEEKEGTVIVE